MKLPKKKKDYILLTNAPRPNHAVKSFLEKLGMKKETREHVFTSGEAALSYLKKKGWLFNGMVLLYKYPSFWVLISLLVAVDPPAKAAIDEIGIRISNKKIKVKKELNTKIKNFLNDFFINIYSSIFYKNVRHKNLYFQGYWYWS